MGRFRCRLAFMRFHEKLRRRVAQLGLNKAKAAREVGLPESTISNYLVKEESLPRIDIALKIAKAIDVPLEWLADDSADFPLPEAAPKASPSKFDDEILMLEVAERQRRSMIRVLNALERAEKEDWATAVSRLTKSELFGIIFPIRYLAEMIGRFQPAFVARLHHNSMPGAERPIEDFDQKAIGARALKMFKDVNFVAACQAIIEAFPPEAITDIETDLTFGKSIADASEENVKPPPSIASKATSATKKNPASASPRR